MVLGNFQFRGVLLIWITVGQGFITLAVGAGGGCLDIFPLIYLFSISFLSPSLWETARYRLKGPLNSKQLTNQNRDGTISTEILSQKAVKPKETNQPNSNEYNFYRFGGNI